MWLVRLAFFSIAFVAGAADVNTDYITPEFTYSPDRHYGVTIPIFHFEAADKIDDRTNKVVELGSQKIVADFGGDPGYDRALNYRETTPPRWSSDSSLILWKVNGKWCPHTLVLLALENNQEKWRLDLLKTAQQSVLARTRSAAPKRYKLAKKSNAGSGAAYPDGFTIDVTTEGENTTSLALPLTVHADLTANPKQIPGEPNLDSHLDALVTVDGKFVVKHFQLGKRN